LTQERLLQDYCASRSSGIHPIPTPVALLTGELATPGRALQKAATVSYLACI
jgi:hypothetical protein